VADEETQDETVEEAPIEPEAAAEAVPEPEVEATPEVVETAEPVAEAADAPEAEEAAAEEAAEPAAAEPVAEAATAEPSAPEAETPAAVTPAAVTEEAATPEPPGVTQPKKKRKRLPRSLRHKHAKPVRDTSAPRKPIVRTPKPETELGRRQERRGVVVSDKGDKSIVVKVEMTRAHPRYKKVVRRSRKLHAHDEQNAASIGDVVRIIETRPISKLKNWRLAEIVEKAR
jgi:small subunit ribosomal protein S17